MQTNTALLFPHSGNHTPSPLTITPQTILEENIGREITPPPHILHYIKNSDSKLTRHEIDNLEIAIEKHHNITSPFFITTGHSKSINATNPLFILEKE